MVAKFTLFLTAFATLALAAPSSPGARNIRPKVEDTQVNNVSQSQCDTGSVQCCNSVGDASSEPFSAILALLNLGDLTGNIGLSCTNVVGVTSCTQQPVCCTGNKFNGLVNVGCSPIAL